VRVCDETVRDERKFEGFSLSHSVRDWRIVHGPILMKFQYVVPDDESYVLIGVDRWISSPVAWLLKPTW
jgi:hypothetical protein